MMKSCHVTLYVMKLYLHSLFALYHPNDIDDRYKFAILGFGDHLSYVCDSELDLLRGLAAKHCVSTRRRETQPTAVDTTFEPTTGNACFKLICAFPLDVRFPMPRAWK